MLNKIEIVFCFHFFHSFSSLINFKIVGYNKLKINTYTHMFKKDLANVPKFFDTLEKDFNEKSSK